MSHSALAAGIRNLRRKLATQQGSEDSDERLLEAFTAQRDEAAFAALVRRHGPMVLQVCRRVLGHEQDAEDAFQATFLVLARDAAALRKKNALAGFLHGTAYRLALSAKRAAARRRKHEGSLGALTQPRSQVDPAEETSWREVRALLDEEIARLPEKYRSVFVLCCLEELSRAEAGLRLGLKERTVLSRLAVARQRLQRRLARRGVELTVLLAATTLGNSHASALPSLLIASMIQAVGGLPTGVVSPAIADLVRSVAPAVVFNKMKLAAKLFLVMSVLAGASVWNCRAFVNPQSRQLPEKPPQPPSAATRQPSKPAVEIFTYAGRVLGPDGKPLAGAKVYINRLKLGVNQFSERAISGPDGKFRFQVRRDEFHNKGIVPPGRDPPERYVAVAATADGCGGTCVSAGKPEEREKLTLWLPEEEIVRGRVINPEGRGVAGVSVSASLRSSRADKNHKPLPYDAPDKEWHYGGNILPSDNANAVTDKEGRFVIRGLSRGWLYDLFIDGPTVVNAKAELVARPQKTRTVGATGIAPPDRPRPRLPQYGSTFTHVAMPCKPIVGVVRDKESGKPLAGIEVNRPWTRDDDPQAWATTDKDGRYKLLGLPRGIHTLHVEPPLNVPYLTTEVRVVADQPGIAPVTFDISLERQPTVSGRVIDRATGKAVSGAWVEYRPLAGNPSLKTNPHLAESRWPRNHLPGTATDGDGRFTLPVLRGRGVLLVSADDRYLPARLEKVDRIDGITDTTDPELIDCRPLPAWPGDFHAYRLIDVTKGKEASVEIRLVRGIARQLVIEFPDSEPRDTMVLGLKPPANDHGDTYHPGKSSVLGLADDETRRLFLSTYDGRFAAATTVNGKDKGPVKVKLKPNGTITGRVVDKDGKPIAGVGFRLFFDDGPGRRGIYLHGSSIRRVHTAMESRRAWRTKGYLDERIGSRAEKSDVQGRFRLPDVLPDAAFDLQAVLIAPPDRKGQRIVIGEVKIARSTVRPGETLDLGTLRAVAPPKK